MTSKNILDIELESELNRNIDLVLNSANRIQEDHSSYKVDIPNLTYDQALSELSRTASDILNVTSMLRPPASDGSYSQVKYNDPAVKSASMLLLCSQIRQLQKLAMAMRMMDE